MDLHAAQIQGYFDIPLDHLQGGKILADYFNEKQIEDLVVVSPDLGSVTRSRKFANGLDGDVPLAIIDKRRPKANEHNRGCCWKECYITRRYDRYSRNNMQCS